MAAEEEEYVMSMFGDEEEGDEGDEGDGDDGGGGGDAGDDADGGDEVLDFDDDEMVAVSVGTDGETDEV